MSDHSQHCFVAVPYGRDEGEHARIQGWIDELMTPVVDKLGLQLEIAAARSAPNAITLEIREHLAFDALAIFDLGGVTADTPPNPNVMYELGIRHAFDLPAVVMAWEKQELPFDIQEHRVIRQDRHFGTLQWHRDKLTEFGRAALGGDFFRPMNAVRVAKLLEQLVATSGNDALIGLSEQVKELRQAVTEMIQRQRPAVLLSTLADLGKPTSLNELYRLATKSTLVEPIVIAPSSGMKPESES